MLLITALPWSRAMRFCGHVKSAFPRDEPKTQLGSRPGSAAGNGHRSLEQESQPESLGSAGLHKPTALSVFPGGFRPCSGQDWDQNLEGASRGAWGLEQGWDRDSGAGFGSGAAPWGPTGTSGPVRAPGAPSPGHLSCRDLGRAGMCSHLACIWPCSQKHFLEV